MTSYPPATRLTSHDLLSFTTRVFRIYILDPNTNPLSSRRGPSSFVEVMKEILAYNIVDSNQRPPLYPTPF